MRRVNGASQAGVLLAICGLSAAPAMAQVLFEEDFESFQLFQNQDEGVDTGQIGCQEFAFIGDGVACEQMNTENPGCGPDFIDCASYGYTNTLFDGVWSYGGWTSSFSLPGVGTLEWQGWSVTDYNWWQFTAGDQRRSEFSKASGKVLVADPDEWDDYDPFIDDPESVGPYDTEIISPVIDISTADENSVVIRFDSSWRPEKDSRNQQARLSVRFDGGAWEEYLYWSSDENDPNYHDHAPNETVDLAIMNPLGASTMEISIELFEAGNDWWWAIDDLKVFNDTGDPVDPPQEFTLNALTFNPDTTPDVDWTESLNATSYDVIFANDENFNDVVLQDETFNLAYTPAAGVLQAGVYWVKVVAKNSLGTYEVSKQIGIDNDCPADLDGNGVSNTQDFLRYLNFWSGGCD